MSEVKQEGTFKIEKKKTPKKLVKQDGPVKVNLSNAELKKPVEEPTKVVIPSQEINKKEENAIQEQSTESSLLGGVEQSSENREETKVGLQKMGEGDQDSLENVQNEEIPLIQEITEEEVQEQTEDLKHQIDAAREQSEQSNVSLPENIEKLVSFMEETGGTIEDYVRLNADYSNINNDTLIREYYSKTKPHLDREEINFLIEDNFSYDEDLDDERDIRKKKLAYKEEIAKAKDYLESVKSKYYDEIKLRKPSISEDQQKALDFFNRYKKDQDVAKANHESFKNQTKNFFNQEFKGFDFSLGEKKFRYGLQNASQVADTQSDINNILGKFLNQDGSIKDIQGYHKAMYAANNADRIAQHFYEQGKADAIKDVVTKSKNPSMDAPRAASDNGFINGLKIKSISGLDSSKLKIQTKKFN